MNNSYYSDYLCQFTSSKEINYPILGLPPPRFGKEFGSPQLDEVGDASLQVDVSAISKMYRKKEEALNNAIKTVKDIAKANNEDKGI